MAMSSVTPTIPAGETAPKCQALIESASLSIYRENAFRITGLTVDAGAKERARHADRLKIMEELGQGEAANSSAFALNPPPSLDQIREASRRLTDPEKRLIDEFFWFWPITFGNSASDPGLQAIMRGDPSGAYAIWAEAENNPKTGFVATHNIAVMCHLLAVEWTLYEIATPLDSDREEEIRTYWSEAFTRWKKIFCDDLVWDTIKARIRSVDDARLTAGFGRRMCNSLPQALGKINAEAAIKFAEQGQFQLARTHVDFMRESQQSLDSLAKTAELVLAPARTRLKQQIERARQRAGNSQSEVLTAARELLEHARQFAQLFDLFLGKDGRAQNELSDEVATVCNQLPIAYHKATGDHKGCIELLKAALPFAVSSELRQEIQNSINVLMVREIEDSKLSPKAKLAKIRQEIIPIVFLFRKVEETGHIRIVQAVSDEFANFVAISLRGISIDAHNDHDDLETALDAIGLASDLAHEPELKERLAQDRTQIQENQKGRIQLLLNIRSDEIEVTREKVRYNSHVLPSGDINGVRFGIFVRYSNGSQTSVSYLIGVNSARHGAINFECKRLFRSEEKAKADFHAIVTALYHQIIPSLCLRMSRHLAAGNKIPLGDCWMTDKGILATTGTLLWKETQLIPWSDVRFHSQSGHLYIASTQKGQVAKSFSLRDVWNAVILEELASTIVALKSKQQYS
jgi:hypothetical protein